MTRYQQIIQKVAQKNNLSEELVDKVWKAYWKGIKYYLQQSDFKQDISKDQFDKLVTSINIPSLGKIYCTYDMYISKRNHYKQYKSEEQNVSN